MLQHPGRIVRRTLPLHPGERIGLRVEAVGTRTRTGCQIDNGFDQRTFFQRLDIPSNRGSPDRERMNTEFPRR